MPRIRKQNIKQIKLSLKMNISIESFVKDYAKIWRESNNKRNK